MDIREISKNDIGQVASLLKESFPNSEMTVEYLNWLYFGNPLGNVVGYNAFKDDELISHYACIPIRVGEFIGLLSVNTATHPNHRSKGLYQNLANLTYDKYKEGFTFVVGVANAQSAPAFLKYLGFQEIGRLNLRVGRIRIPEGTTRVWDANTLNWRLASPKSKYNLVSHGNGIHTVSTRRKRIPLRLRTTVVTRASVEQERRQQRKISSVGITLDWNRHFKPRIYLPERFKPSPLILIVKFLGQEVFDLDSWSFLDFDAF